MIQGISMVRIMRSSLLQAISGKSLFEATHRNPKFYETKEANVILFSMLDWVNSNLLHVESVPADEAFNLNLDTEDAIIIAFRDIVNNANITTPIVSEVVPYSLEKGVKFLRKIKYNIIEDYMIGFMNRNISKSSTTTTVAEEDSAESVPETVLPMEEVATTVNTLDIKPSKPVTIDLFKLVSTSLNIGEYQEYINPNTSLPIPHGNNKRTKNEKKKLERNISSAIKYMVERSYITEGEIVTLSSYDNVKQFTLSNDRINCEYKDGYVVCNIDNNNNNNNNGVDNHDKLRQVFPNMDNEILDSRTLTDVVDFYKHISTVSWAKMPQFTISKDDSNNTIFKSVDDSSSTFAINKGVVVNNL